MSNVTDIILTASLGVTPLDAVNDYFTGEHGDAVLHQVDKPADSPGKAIQGDIFIGAFNYLKLGEFVAHLRGLDWDGLPETVRLFVQEEHDEHGFHEVAIWEGGA